MWYTNSVAQPAANFISNNNVIKLLTNGLWASHVDPNDLCRIINDQMSFMTLTCLFSYLESFIISSHWCWWILHCSSRENPNCVSSSPTQYASPRHVNACWLQVAVKKSKVSTRLFLSSPSTPQINTPSIENYTQTTPETLKHKHQQWCFWTYISLQTWLVWVSVFKNIRGNI